MALDSWAWFITLAEKGNFTRAAEELGISQQALSARLATLEKELDARLMTRSTPLSLTPAGEEFLAFAAEQDRASIELKRRIGDASAGGSGVLKIAIGTMLARMLMPYVIEVFHKGFPNVRIELIEGTNEELLRMAEHGEVDLVIARFDRSHLGIVSQPLFEESIVVAIHPELLAEQVGCSADEARERVQQEGLALLKDCPFLLGESDDSAGRLARRLLKSAGIRQEALVTCESMTILLRLASQRIGAVFCPASMLESALGPAKELVAVTLPEPVTYQISVGRPVDAEPWTPAEAFEDILGTLFQS